MLETNAVDGLPTTLASLISLERAIQGAARDLAPEVEGHEEVSALLVEVESTAAAHAGALTARLRELDSDGLSVGVGGGDLPGPLGRRGIVVGGAPVSSALGSVYSILQEAVIGYSTVQAIASRIRDSWIIASEGTTGHVMRDCTQDYVRLAGRVTGILHEVLVAELAEQDRECVCLCPLCGVGVCICAAGGRHILGEALAAAKLSVVDEGIPMSTPRLGSAAAAAGLRTGDVVMAIDGRRVDSLAPAITAVRDRAVGDVMRFKVLREGRAVILDVERREDLVDPRTMDEDDCIQPSGQEFDADRARSVQARLLAMNGAGSAGERALARLSVREIQVLLLVADGAENPTIAAALDIQRSTVARHVQNILRKLGLPNRQKAASLAAVSGLLDGA